jgi:Ricin-type beta-trefoil lectin domain
LAKSTGDTRQIWQYDPWTMEIRINVKNTIGKTVNSKIGDEMILCLETNNLANSLVESNNCNGADSQKWQWQTNGQIKSKSSQFSKCLDNASLVKSDRFVGKNLKTETCNTAAQSSQFFGIKTNSQLILNTRFVAGRVYIKSQSNPSFALQIPLNAASLTPLESFGHSGDYNQKWFYDPAALQIKMTIGNSVFCIDGKTSKKSDKVVVEICNNGKSSQAEKSVWFQQLGWWTTTPTIRVLL